VKRRRTQAELALLVVAVALGTLFGAF